MINKQKILLYLGYAVALLTLLSLLFLAQATQGSQKFENYYHPLLVSITFGISLLFIIVIIHLYKVIVYYRKKIPGASLSLTILWRSLLLAFFPLLFVSYFAFKFLNYEFQSSFDKGIDQALSNALVLSKKALNVQALQALEDSRDIGKEFALTDYAYLQRQLNDMRQRSLIYELTLIDEKGFIQAFSSQDMSTVIPMIPEYSDFVRVSDEGGIFSLESKSSGLYIRTLLKIKRYDERPLYLQAVFRISDTVSQLTRQINRTISERDRFNHLMPQVNRSFVFVLLLVMSMAILFLILTSINFASDMAQPIRLLIQGTKRLSKGDFTGSILVKRNDDFGSLMKSFNRMTHSLKTATEEAERNRERVESERAYLETIIEHMTAGVMTLDYEYRLQTYNNRAESLLSNDLSRAIYTDLTNLEDSLAIYKHLINQVLFGYNQGKSSEIEVEVNVGGESQILIANITPLPSTDDLHGGYVVIFEVLGQYLQQQKQAAWEEVARRLAHEIKNPLTPIQLAAERLDYKLSGHLQEKEQRVLSRSIEVITKQVKSLKDMVNDFSDFAKPTSTSKVNLAFNLLLKDVFDLYRGHYANVNFHLDMAADNDNIHANAQVLRQVLHNLIKNAIEACEARCEKQADFQGEITLSLRENASHSSLVLNIIDNGIGLPDSGNAQVFEPYVTTKEKGTGLGLAIVKKIIQEHQGSVKLSNRQETQGSVVTIELPLAERNTKHKKVNNLPITVQTSC